MTRDDCISELKASAPMVTEITETYDMGFEFSAVVPNGFIYSEPGMLLAFSDGYWPPNDWQGKTDEEVQILLKDFLLDETWPIIAWENLGYEEVAHWLKVVRNLEHEKSNAQK